MAGWTVTGSGWAGARCDQYGGVVDQLIAALNERSQLLTSTNAIDNPGTYYDAGFNNEDDSIWLQMQAWIAANASSFVQSHDSSGVIHPAQYFDGLSSLPMWTFSDLMTSASYDLFGASITNWLRVQGGVASPGPGSGGWLNPAHASYSSGGPASGDIIGPWLPALIQVCLDRMIWVNHFGGAGSTRETRSGISTGNPASFALARTAAETAWAAASWTAGSGDLEAASEQLYSAGSRVAHLFREATNLTTTAPALFGWDVDFYVKASVYTTAGDEFDANGVTVAVQDTLKFMETLAATAGNTTNGSTEWGKDNTKPNWSTNDPDSGTPGGRRGFLGGSFIAVGRLNKSGGFTYY